MIAGELNQPFTLTITSIQHLIIYVPSENFPLNEHVSILPLFCNAFAHSGERKNFNDMLMQYLELYLQLYIKFLKLIV